MYKNIAFISQEALLRGRLYLPEKEHRNYPVVVMAHGFTTTINGMTADKYAEQFCEAGFAVLLYDHRNFGISEGEPRQQICFWVQARGYIDGIDFLTTRSEIDTTRIAVWGASMSAREAFFVGSVDERVKAIVNVIPAYGDDFPVEDKDDKQYSFAKQIVLTERIMELPHTVSDNIPIVSSNQIDAPSALTELTAFRWFIEYGGRYGTNWRNYVSFVRINDTEQFHLGHCAAHIKVPILMVVATNDEMSGASNKVVDEVYNRITQPKERVAIDGGHFGLLHYPSTIFDIAARAQIEFLQEYL